jgi:uncharacterized caspase-like protein
MNLHPLYQPTYSGSHALIIGINRYQHVSPLSCARNDAEAVADILIRKFRFPSQRVTLLTDAAATREGIRTAFFKYVQGADVQPDDRIIVFFAGHGHTVRGRRGETGFLIPVDGKLDATVEPRVLMDPRSIAGLPVAGRYNLTTSLGAVGGL